MQIDLNQKINFGFNPLCKENMSLAPAIATLLNLGVTVAVFSKKPASQLLAFKKAITLPIKRTGLLNAISS